MFIHTSKHKRILKCSGIHLHVMLSVAVDAYVFHTCTCTCMLCTHRNAHACNYMVAYVQSVDMVDMQARAYLPTHAYVSVCTHVHAYVCLRLCMSMSTINRYSIYIYIYICFFRHAPRTSLRRSRGLFSSASITRSVLFFFFVINFSEKMREKFDS